jgi:iron(III) transport system substrate-binding protein
MQRLNGIATASKLHRFVIACAMMCFHGAGVYAQSLEETHQRALKEDATLNVYGTLTPDTAAKILPLFEKRFPGVKAVNTGASSDKIVARAISEARGGRTIGDVFHMNLENVMQVHEQGLVLEKLPPEADAFPSHLKGSFWVATRFNTLVAAWNTRLVAKSDEPKTFEEFAEAKWKGKLLAEPRDAEFLIAFAEQKYKDSERAVALFKKIAANQVEFHSGHPQLAELLTAGQGAVCLTCYTHHLIPRMHKGAPLTYMRSFGVGLISATAVFKNAPHPNAAWLFHRWAASDEGQKAFGIEGRVPANPNVQAAEAIGLETVYGLGEKEYKEFVKYEKIWKQIFSLR